MRFLHGFSINEKIFNATAKLKIWDWLKKACEPFGQFMMGRSDHPGDNF